MKFCRINLSKTNYSTNTLSWDFVVKSHINILRLEEIYRKYCAHKKFPSVMPLFYSQYQDPWTDIVGYSHNEQLVAFSLIKKYDFENAECLQFAWDYVHPNLRLGCESLMVECAIYKSRGFKYLYLGQAADYKSKLDGYEILGPI